MSLQFHRAVEKLEVWSASSVGLSFVITFASPSGPGFHGRSGFLASWRPLFNSSVGAVKVVGSPFNTFADAEDACNEILTVLEPGVSKSQFDRTSAPRFSVADFSGFQS
jgi:hypothetical protein